MATKRPKKPAGEKAAAPAAGKSKGKKKAAAPAKAESAAEERVPVAREEEGDEDGDDDLDLTPTPAAKPKPAAAPGASHAGGHGAKKPGALDPEAPAVVPARRLTPEARAQLNALLAKGVSLQEALKQVAKWETFVAPVREPQPVAAGPGPRGDGAPRRPAVHDDDEEPAAPKDLDDEPILDADE